MYHIKNIIKTIINHKAFQNFIIVGVIAVFQLINNVILGRGIDKDQFGQYSFVFNNIVGVLSILLLFGRNSSIIRYFSSKDFLDYRWKKYLLKDSMMIIVPLLVAMIGIKIFYKLDWFWFWMGTISSYSMCLTYTVAAFLRAKGYFTTTTLLERAHPVVLTLILSILFFKFNNINITSASIAKIISYSIQIPIILYMLIKWREGTQQIGKDIFKNNMAFWELNVSVIVLTSIDAFFIAKILSFEELALFAIAGSVFQIFDFARTALFQVYSQKFSSDDNIDVIKFNMVLIVVTILLLVFYMLSTNFILNILFHGKYTLTLTQLILFCLYSAVAFLYTLPACYVIGQSSAGDLRFMLGVNLSSIVIKIGLILLLSGYGLSGFIIAGITGQFVRTAFGYYMVVKNKKMKWTMFFKLNSKSDISPSEDYT